MNWDLTHIPSVYTYLDNGMQALPSPNLDYTKGYDIGIQCSDSKFIHRNVLFTKCCDFSECLTQITSIIFLLISF